MFERNYHPGTISKSGHLREHKFHIPHGKVNQKPIFSVPILNNSNKNTNQNSHSNSSKKNNELKSNRPTK
jgi:hypothetical protein